MSRYAHAVTLKSWKQRHTKKPAKPVKRRKEKRRAEPAPPPRVERRDRSPSVIYDEPPPDDDEKDVEGWDGDVDDLPDVWEDVGDEPRKRTGLVARLRDVLSRRWGKPAQLGEHMQLRAREGFRAAVVEVKPGLYVVAEVPQTAVEFGFGPLLLAPALVKTLSKALRKRGHGDGALQIPQVPEPRALPGPTTDDRDDTEGRLPQWVDGEVAAELGCDWKKGGRR